MTSSFNTGCLVFAYFVEYTCVCVVVVVVVEAVIIAVVAAIFVQNEDIGKEFDM